MVKKTISRKTNVIHKNVHKEEIKLNL